MQLDLPTLMAMGSLATASAGAVLLVAWLQNRNVTALGIWGLSDIIAAAGIFMLMLGAVSHLPLRSMMGAILLALSHGLVWKAARTFDAKPAPLPLALLGMIAVGVANFAPGLQYIAGSAGPAVGVIYIASAGISLWLAREEQLPARGPIIVLTAVHTVVLTIGIYSFFNRAVGADRAASVMNLFGLIPFEGMIFFSGTAAFLLSLAKERGEAASRAAANIDPLTGIANRASLMERAQRTVERCKRDNAPVSVLMFDLDRFKTINDSHGHAVGDEVIKTFCEATADMLRPTDIFGRVGGEEFAIVMPGASIEAAAVRADRIRASFAASCRFVRGHPVNATVSAGVATAGSSDACTFNTLLESADNALYCAKAAGRNRIERARQGPEPTLPAAIRVA
jgi:diguanylate cyclase (GGDEF)-like protein